jgi:hypothetical protein
MESTTIYVIAYFVVSATLGHILLHRVCRKKPEYLRPSLTVSEKASQGHD